MPQHTKNRFDDLTAAQIRAARALLDWPGPKLAEVSALSLHTIRRMEALGSGHSTAANAQAVRRALQGAGVIFESADEAAGLGPGVRLKN